MGNMIMYLGKPRGMMDEFHKTDRPGEPIDPVPLETPDWIKRLYDQDNDDDSYWVDGIWKE